MDHGTPTYATWAGHGQPQRGFYWGNDPDGIDTTINGRKLIEHIEYTAGPGDQLLKLTAYDSTVTAVTPPGQPFWFSADAPSPEYWAQRAAQQGR